MEKLKVAICGLGGLGRVHANTLAGMDEVEIVAVCDTNPARLQPQEVKINLETGGERQFDVRQCRTYADLNAMLRKERPELLVTALPTDLHATVAITAMRRGCHVFSEKPMALTVRECDRICRVAAQTGRRFMTAQCLRFWPEYEALLTAVREQPYGPLQSLTMTRIGSYATWSDWFNNGARSGGAILDLHLHDVDWAFHAFGAPAALWAAGRRGKTGEYDDVTAVWQYPEFNVTLRGSWMYQGFCMSFQALFAEAAMDFGMHPDPALRVRRAGNAEAEKIAVPAESGYQREIRYFLDVIRGCREHDLCPPESTRNSVQMVYMEREAIAKSRPVTKFKLI